MSDSQVADPTVRNRRLAGVLLLLAVGGAAGAVTAAVLRDERPARPSAGGEQSGTGTGTIVGGTEGTPPGDGAPEGVFHITGRATGLLPGRPATLALRVTNPNPWPIHVLTLDTEVTQPPGDCPPGSLRVDPYDAKTGERYAAPALGSVEVPVRIAFADSPDRDQTGCAGVTFPLTMTGTAVRTR